MIWKDYLAFSKKQKSGFWVLMILILLISIYIVFPKPNNGGLKIILSNQLSDDFNVDSIQQIVENPSTVIPNYFDPNSASIEELQTNGFSNSAINNLKKYIKAGGHFNRAEDLLKIYGVDSLLYSKVTNYVKIETVDHGLNTNQQTAQNARQYHFDLNMVTIDELRSMGVSKSVIDTIMHLRSKYWINLRIRQDEFVNGSVEYQCAYIQNSLVPKANRHPVDRFVMELNSADTSQLMLLPGIGPTLSNRIVRYRNKLGGYFSVSQLNEVYGLTPKLVDSLKFYLTIDTLLINPLNVNTASISKLKEHPYIGFYKAKDIIEHRKEKGQILNLSEVFQLKAFNSSDWQRIHYYLCK